MGVRILHDNNAGQACLFCSTSDFAFGPVFDDLDGRSAEERAQAFLRWIDGYHPSKEDLNAGGLAFGFRNHDPRLLSDAGMERAYNAWRAQEAHQFQTEEETAA